MDLEDHIGDVIQKARLHEGISLEAAARAAGVSPTELQRLEQNGTSSRAPAYGPLAELLGLNTTKLEGLAQGWRPPPVDLSQWHELRQVTTGGGGFSVNCFLAWDEVTREAALFDTGFDPEPVFALMAENQLTLRYLFITHSHHDHVAGLGAVKARFPKVRVRWSAPQASLDQRNRPNDFLQLGSLRITNRATPGHAEDGVTYIIGTWPEDAPHVAMVGDALFAGSMGRAVGQAVLARQMIVEQILSLPGPTLLCPGHGPLTTVAEERAHNPFF